MIIFLNGTSSVGKSSIAREIMRQSKIPFIYHAADHILNFWIDSKFVNLFDENQVPEKWQSEWFCRQQIIDKEGNKVTYTNNGQKGIQLYFDVAKASCSLIEKGYNMIIDEAIRSEIQLSFYYQMLFKKTVYLISVICDERECEKREKQRGDRYVGLSRGLRVNVESLIHDYDLKIDTTNTIPTEGAQSILNYIECNPKPTAFQHCVSAISMRRNAQSDPFIL